MKRSEAIAVWVIALIVGIVLAVAASRFDLSSSTDIPYRAWWFLWGLLALIAAPVAFVFALTRRRIGALAVVLPVPLLAAISLLDIVGRCNGLGYSGCDRSAAIMQGWVTIVVGYAALAGVGFYLAGRNAQEETSEGRPGLPDPDGAEVMHPHD